MTILFYEHHGLNGRWGEIIFDRPDALNAINDYMSERLYFALEAWLSSQSITKIVIRSSTNNFCAGADLDSLLAQKSVEVGSRDDYILRQYQIISMIRAANKPVYVMASGATVGFGAGLFMAANHRICDSSFYLAMPECSIGFFPDVGACKFMLGFPNYSDVFFGGATLGAQDLLEANLLTALIPFENFSAWLHKMQPDFMLTPYTPKVFNRPISPMSRYYTQQLLAVASGLSYSKLAIIEYALANEIVSELDFTEGILAFKTKRSPTWCSKGKPVDFAAIVDKLPTSVVKSFYG